jgi:hypothetical protein
MDVRSGKDGTLELHLEGYEAHLLRDLTGEMRSVLEEQDRKDPVTARLFPPAYDDARDDEAFRELIGGDLKNAKLRALEVVTSRLGGRGGIRCTIPADEVDSWLRALTDLRLAIGTRLDVTDETMDEEIDPEDPDGPSLSLLHWLGWMQESMLGELMGGR